MPTPAVISLSYQESPAWLSHVYLTDARSQQKKEKIKKKTHRQKK